MVWPVHQEKIRECRGTEMKRGWYLEEEFENYDKNIQ